MKRAVHLILGVILLAIAITVLMVAMGIAGNLSPSAENKPVHPAPVHFQ